MTDWTAHRQAGMRLMESLSWLAAAALVLVLAASSVALARWLDQRAGEGQAQTVLIDLPPLPPAEAVADDPGPQPDAATTLPAAPPPPPPAADDRPEAQEADDTPELAEAPPAPELTPTEAQPRADVALPEPPKAEPQEKPVEKAKAPVKKKRKAEPKPEAAAPAAKSGAMAAAGNAAPADAMKKWVSSAQRQLARHMQRKNYDGRGEVRLLFSVAASGAITGVSLQGSSGDAALDAAILAQGRRAPSLPPKPDGTAGQLVLPVRSKG